jgi:hypothetical protein
MQRHAIFRNKCRYLEIERNGAARLRQGSLNSGFSPSYNTWYRKSCVVDRWSSNSADCGIGICKGQFGFNRQISRIAETKIQEATSRYGFFIKEVRDHYEVYV